MLKSFKPVLLGSVLFAASALCAADSDLERVMKERNLSEKDVLAAAKTYQPTGRKDDYMVFSSGGQSGQVIVYGVPSMRIYKYIGVFTPEPWQGYGFDEESKAVLRSGSINGKEINWGDTHHPNFSEKNGEYVGDYLFINDKANPRIAVINLSDFETTQIVVNPVIKSDHGGSFVTPNTEYVIETSQYAAPFDNDWHPIEEYQAVYRGAVTLWKFDYDKGKIDVNKSFSLELPPYMQDLSDAGKGESFGWAFTNSFNSEMYTGGIEKGLPPMEAGMSRNDTDYLHVYNWQILEKLAQDSKNYKVVNGHRIVTIDAAVKAGALFLIPEAKSPHGVDVSPDGRYIIIGGKLDTHASVYDFKKIKELIDKKEYAGKDPYGIPILDMQKTLHGQAELGLGPLHNTFDSQDGVIYTSLYVDSQIVKWNYKTLKVLDRINVHYNIGHLDSMEGKSSKPVGKYVIALDKLSIDRFNPIGPLHPQNHQLIDITGPKMEMLYDLPIGLGEPHDVVSIAASKLHTKPTYTMGTNSRTGKQHPAMTLAGQERIERDGKNVKVYATAIRSHINPEHIEVNKDDNVTIYMTNLERAEDETHGFTVDDYDLHMSLEPGKTASVNFIADKEGVFPFYCTEFCSALHLEMFGYLYVKDPNKKYTSAKASMLKALSPEALKAEYDKVVATNKATDDVIQSVVKFLKEKNYEKYPKVKALVDDALDQYGKIPETKAKADAAVKAGDMNGAILWEGQVWQYLVKTADVGLRAKNNLIRELSTPMSEAASNGEKAYLRGGCNGCHVIGQVSSGPDLTGVLLRHENGEKWVADFIKDPAKFYEDDYVKAMINYFNLRMPNQHMKDEEIKDIIEYLKWVDENAGLN
ncbi:MAG: Sec-dependent nitrous-oxide reductase [Campylobacter sp.]|uniref:Cytochrome C oxidase subunit II, periplasmic domain protein n=7 Tax=Campylobacter TaxID=194 RepID=C8PGZ9_9BACT|nr:Sec-dependent nitrous-oxide reductase [Campylobacter gracilis]RKV91313.1 MAG: Sec-dependent nitrous-oxide reductase [Campylobacter sp.]AKT93397.1 nitrous oxide reductase [Campylobacter gracilis]EEV17820.1 Cytochrome C oxidase subunit II, periplasmic domain protein [Campylobacter gracilis RM3268]UEB46500.1 Sec-dependent nitrous-oxide reductase [Campylobacter gracilis]SUW78275.1 4Fe-4S ferredoxin iron-sulfur binding domain-containing protein [Campylobacter gracilis]